MGDARSADHTPQPTPAITLDTRSLEATLNLMQQQRQQHLSSTPSPQTVYIVTDTCYPTANDFDANKGTASIDSVHSTKRSANARAKKIIFQSAKWKVDIDKIIEEVTAERGLYTGIGIGGNGDGKKGNCYARKCGVESKIVDEDSEDEVDEDVSSSQEERETSSIPNTSDGDGDVRMG